MTLRAGAAVAPITPGVGVPMGGYGARILASQGHHDDLLARTLVLDDGATRLVLSVCDLVAVTTDIVAEARALIASECGVPPSHVCIAATHTHSGPGTLRRKDGSAYVSHVARAIAGSALMALATPQEVVLKLGTTTVDTVSQNRRHSAGPRETQLTVLLADPGGAQPPVATLLTFACHATVLEHDNLDWSADFPGAACRVVERELGGVAVYLQGACGDVNPVWMRHDAADVSRVGGIVGTAAARAAHEVRPQGEGQWGINLSWGEEIAQEPGGVLLEDVGLAAATATVALPRKAPCDGAGVEREIAALEARSPGRAQRERLSELRMVRAVMSRRSDRVSEDIEIQAFRLASACALVSLPGEFFADTARVLRERVGVEHLLVAGYANGYVGYVPPAAAYPRGGYEVGISRFAPGAEAAVVEAAVALVGSLAR